MSDTAELSIQESLYPELTCWGCGHANPDGFHLRSYRQGELTVGEFTSRPEHDNGFGFLNGGIITTVLDCHTAAVVMWEASQRGWEAAPGRAGPVHHRRPPGALPAPDPVGRHRSAVGASRPDLRTGDRGGGRAVGRQQAPGHPAGLVAPLHPALTRPDPNGRRRHPRSVHVRASAALNCTQIG